MPLLTDTVPAPSIRATRSHTTQPTAADYIAVARATRTMLRRSVSCAAGSPKLGGKSDREMRVAIALVWHLTTWTRFDDEIARVQISARAGLSVRTTNRAVQRLHERGAITRQQRGPRAATIYGLPTFAVATNEHEPDGDRADIATVSDALRRFCDKVLRSDISRSGIVLAAAIIAELVTWTHLEGDLNRDKLLETWGLSRSSLRRAYLELTQLGVIETGARHDRHGNLWVRITTAVESPQAAPVAPPVEPVRTVTQPLEEHTEPNESCEQAGGDAAAENEAASPSVGGLMRPPAVELVAALIAHAHTAPPRGRVPAASPPTQAEVNLAVAWLDNGIGGLPSHALEKFERDWGKLRGSSPGARFRAIAAVVRVHRAGGDPLLAQLARDVFDPERDGDGRWGVAEDMAKFLLGRLHASSKALAAHVPFPFVRFGDEPR